VSVRLNKFLADRGVASRRASDRLIEQGRVSINGRVVTDLGTKVEEQRDRVSVNGKPVGGAERHVYFVLNKPVGVITTLNDPEGRRTVKELLPRGARIYPVGRLDADTSGLLLLTNDGELAHRLMHPRYGVAKVYRVRLAREPRPDQMRRLSTGVRFDRDLVSGPARVRRIDPGFDAIMIEMVVHEGRFRQVRKMCEAVGLEVTGLHRVGYGPIRLGPLARGMFRELSDEEVAKLRAESSRGGRPGPGRTAAAARPQPAERPGRVTREAPSDDGDDGDGDLEETWLPGGGFLEPEAEGESEQAPPRAERRARSAHDRPSEWPARATERRGDDDWRPSPSPPRRSGDGARAGSPGGERGGSPRGERRGSRSAERPIRSGAVRGGSPRGERGGGRFTERPRSSGAARGGSSHGERGGGRFTERPGSSGAARRDSGRGERRGSRSAERPLRSGAVRGGSPRGERRGSRSAERPGSAARRGSSWGDRRGSRSAERPGSSRGASGGSARGERRGGRSTERPGSSRAVSRGSSRGEFRGRRSAERPGSTRRGRPAGRRVAESRVSGRNRRPNPRNPSRRRPR